MTIAIALKVGDGIVLGADSASSMIANGEIHNVYFNAEKIINLLKGKPIGAAVYGLGALKGRSVTSLAKDLRRRFAGDDPQHTDWKLNPQSYTMEDVAKRVREFFYEELFLPEYQNDPGIIQPGTEKFPLMGLIVGGYSAGGELGEVWTITIAVDHSCPPPELQFGGSVCGMIWEGQKEPLNRLVNGFGVEAVQRLVSAGLTSEEAVNVLTAGAPLINPGMPIQDAVDLVRYLIEVTAGYVRFVPGAPSVAPPIDIAAITLHEGYKWVQRKHYFSAELNPTPGYLSSGSETRTTLLRG